MEKNASNINKPGRILWGVVVSNRMTKTVVVAVNRLKRHAKYKKYFRVTRKYKAHDEQRAYHVGDLVAIKEVRPLSKDKRWAVIKKIKEAKKDGENLENRI